MAFRRFEYESGASHKFWEIEVIGITYTARWGKIGTRGQTQKKIFRSGPAAVREASKKMTEKLAKGYVEIIKDGEKTATVPGKTEHKAKVEKPITNDLLEEDLILD